uniref:Uncharacterized protein n=1 Tax=Daphnia magna TaxID=35525 RepID=A0A0P6H3J1_9CRUS
MLLFTTCSIVCRLRFYFVPLWAGPAHAKRTRSKAKANIRLYIYCLTVCTHRMYTCERLYKCYKSLYRRLFRFLSFQAY